MKGCFYLQRKFAPIGNAIAQHLQTYGPVKFCAYTAKRTAYNFLTSQKKVQYTKILLDDEVLAQYKNETLDLNYLKQLEKEYGIPNLWPYLYIDRIIMHGQLVREYPHDKPIVSYEEMLKILQITARTIIKFLKEEKPDFLFISVVGGLSSLLLYHISKKMGIRTIVLGYTRIRNGIALTEDYDSFSWANVIFDELQSGKRKSHHEKSAKDFLEKFRNSPTVFVPGSGLSAKKPTGRLEQLKFLYPPRLWKTIRWMTKFTIQYMVAKERDYMDEVPWYSVWDKIKRKTRGVIGYSRYYSNPEISENFIYFPLHLEPEIATSLYAPFYKDQIHLIKQIARSMPINFKLYVKEHPVMVGYRPMKYYEEIAKIPGVKLIHPSHNSFDLIKSSKLLITLSSTAGWEAIIFKKPVITFGDVPYNKISMVKRCRSFEDLPYFIKNQLENFHYSEEELNNYVAAILEDSVNANIIDLWDEEDQSTEKIENDAGLKEISKLLAKKIGLLK